MLFLRLQLAKQNSTLRQTHTLLTRAVRLVVETGNIAGTATPSVAHRSSDVYPKPRWPSSPSPASSGGGTKATLPVPRSSSRSCTPICSSWCSTVGCTSSAAGTRHMRLPRLDWEAVPPLCSREGPGRFPRQSRCILLWALSGRRQSLRLASNRLCIRMIHGSR